MKNHEADYSRQRSVLTQADPRAASGNGNLTPDEFVGDASAKQRGEPLHTAISVVIPAYNEESAVGGQIVSIREVLRRQGIDHE